MPSAANGKSEKTSSSEATDNSPIRQILTIIEHKIRNLEKRKSKLTSYRDLQKAGKELHADQRVAVAKYDEVSQTLEFARDLSKQMASIAISAEREAKKQAKREAWVRYAAETGKIREVLLILDCLMQMGNSEVREDFLNGANGAVKLTEGDLKILDDLYPEVTPKHEPNEDGQPGFHASATRAAEHLYQITDGKPKEVLGTTYTHIKQIVTSVHECGYFDKGAEELAPAEEPPQPAEDLPPPPAPARLPVDLPAAPAPAVVPQPAYPLRPLPPITLQEVEHAYFAQQYPPPPPPPRPISEVIGSQNFFFLQESEIDSPAPTPQPPHPSPPVQIPSQTFTNQHFVMAAGARVPPEHLPQPHFPPHPDLAAYPPAPGPAAAPAEDLPPPPAPAAAAAPAPAPAPAAPAHNGDEWRESASPERRPHGQGDGQQRGRRPPARPPHYRERAPRGGGGGYQRGKEYPRQYGDHYARHKDGYYGNGDSGNGHHGESDGRERYENGHYQGGYKSRGRGGSRPPRGARQPYRSGKPDHAE